MKLFFLSLWFLSLCINGLSQGKTDSLRTLAKRYIVKNFPVIRTFDIQYEQAASSDYKLKWKDAVFEKGKVRSHSKVKISSTLPVFKNKRFTVYTNLRYSYNHFETGYKKQLTIIPSVLFPYPKSDYHYWEISANATYHSRLFKKAVLYTVNVAADGSEDGFEKMRGMMIATMMLKRTASTVISVGVIAMVNTGSVYPVLPVFSYWHRFGSSPWIVDIGGPGYAYLRRSFTQNDRFSLGVAMGNEHFYVHTKGDGLPGTCYFSKNELKTGAVYEYQCGKHLCFTARAGGITTFRSRLFDKKRINRKPYVDYKQHMNAFFNLGISYNLF